MTPVMKEAGFAQRKTRFQKRGVNDAIVSVQVKIGARNNALLTFGILWSVIPPALAAFLSRDKRLGWPAMYNGLFIVSVHAPASLRYQPEALSEWCCKFDDYDRFGGAFTAELRETIIPAWHAALDPSYLLRTGVGTENAFAFGAPVWRELLLTIDTGDVGRIDALLREASTRTPPEPDLLPWLEARLEARPAGR